MNQAQRVDTYPHIYRYKALQRGLALLIVVILAVGALAVASAGNAHQDQTSAPALILTVFFVGLGAFLLTQAFRSRMVIEGTRIAVRGAFGERSADLNEIEGFRTVRSRYGSVQQLVLKEGRGSISISSGFGTDDAFRKWFALVPDLDQRDREALLAEIDKQQELGTTPEERLDALSRAKRWSIVLLVATVAAAVGANLAPREWIGTIAAVLMLAPLAAAYLCFRSPLLYASFKKTSDPRAEMSFVLIAAGFGLLMRMRELHFVSLRPLAAMMVVVGLVIAAAYHQTARKASNQRAIVGILFFAGLYSYGSVAAVDAFYDYAQANRYATRVVGGHVSRGRSTTYYLRLAPWGPEETDEDVSVPSRIYAATRAGDSVCFDLYPGRLKAPWYRVVPCAPAGAGVESTGSDGKRTSSGGC